MTTMQQEIIEALKVKPVINVEEEIRKSIDFIRHI